MRTIAVTLAFLRMTSWQVVLALLVALMLGMAGLALSLPVPVG